MWKTYGVLLIGLYQVEECKWDWVASECSSEYRNWDYRQPSSDGNFAGIAYGGRGEWYDKGNDHKKCICEAGLTTSPAFLSWDGPNRSLPCFRTLETAVGDPEHGKGTSEASPGLRCEGTAVASGAASHQTPTLCLWQASSLHALRSSSRGTVLAGRN